MSKEEYKKIIARLENIENHQKRKKDIDRLSSIEKSYLTILIMLFGFAISLILYFSGKNETISSLITLIALFIAIIIFYHISCIIINDIEMRIEAFGNTSLYIILIFWFLLMTAITELIEQYVPGIILGLIFVPVGFATGYLYAGYNVEDKITKKIYSQCPILKEEIDATKESNDKIKVQNEAQWMRHFWYMLMIGVLFPIVIYFILNDLGIKEAVYFQYIQILGLFGLIFLLIINTILNKNGK